MAKNKDKNSKEVPCSFKELWGLIFSRLFKRFLRLRLTVKVVVCVFVVILIVILGRIGVLGEKPYWLSKKVIPLTIPIIDAEEPDILLAFTFEVDSESGRTEGKIGGTYRSGNRIFLSINSNVKCWLSIFSVDSKGVYGIYNQSTEPGLFKPQNEPHLISFVLDDNTGTEIYYAIGSHTKFDFAADIKPYLQNTLAEFGTKGPLFSNCWLDLGDEYYQAIIYLSHE